jgi:cytochrome c553
MAARRFPGTCLVLGSLAVTLAAVAQDAMRGERLFRDTAQTTGRSVADCVSCHAGAETLRAQIANRSGTRLTAAGVRRRLDAAFEGAQPGALGAKAQYRGVLDARDLDDLAAYIASSKSVRTPSPGLAKDGR